MEIDRWMIEILVALIHSKSAVLTWYKVKDTVGTSRDFHCDTGKRLNLFLLYELVFGFYLVIYLASKFEPFSLRTPVLR